MDIDFSGLDNEQLIALIRAACIEAVTRGTAVEMAARDAYLSAAERAQAAIGAAEAEAARVRREEEKRVRDEAAAKVRSAHAAELAEQETARQTARWAVRKGVAQAIKGLIGGLCRFGMKDMVLELWQKGADRRIFLGYGFDAGVVAYYVTGGGTGRYAKPPKALENCRKDKEVKANLAKIRELCEAINALWPTGTMKLLLSEALTWDGEPTPLTGYTPPVLPIVTPPPVQTAAAAAPVELPATLRFERRSGIPLVACCSCERFASPDVPAPHLTHSTRCETPDAQIPSGWVIPRATPATEMATAEAAA